MSASSNPLEDAEEQRGEDLPTGGGSGDAEALEAMPEGNAETDDTVAEEPDDPDLSDWEPVSDPSS